MRAVPRTAACVSPRTTIGRASGRRVTIRGSRRRGLAGLAAERQSIRIDAPGGGDAFGSVEAGRLEALILRHCARQIVAAVGRNASVVDVGEVESPSAALLRAALDRSSNEAEGGCRRLFVLPPGRMGRAGPVEGARLLRELGERWAPTTCSSRGPAAARPEPSGETFRRSAGEPIDVAARTRSAWADSSAWPPTPAGSTASSGATGRHATPSTCWSAAAEAAGSVPDARGGHHGADTLGAKNSAGEIVPAFILHEVVHGSLRCRGPRRAAAASPAAEAAASPAGR